MLPPAFAQQKWLLVTIATLLPAVLIGITLQEETAQAHQRASTNELGSLPDGVPLQ